MQQLLLLELQELELLLQLQVKHEREKQMAAPPLLPRSNVTSPNLGFTKCDWLFALFFFLHVPHRYGQLGDSSDGNGDSNGGLFQS